MVADVAFVIDSSYSIKSDDWDTLIQFVKDVTAELELGPDGYRVGVVRFSWQGSIQIRLDDAGDTATLHDALDEMEHKKGATNIAEGLEVMRRDLFTAEFGDREFAPNIAILITDGYANDRENDTLDEARYAKEAGISLITIGISNNVNFAELAAIASVPEDFFPVVDFETLRSVINKVLGVICVERTKGNYNTTPYTTVGLLLLPKFSTLSNQES